MAATHCIRLNAAAWNAGSRGVNDVDFCQFEALFGHLLATGKDGLEEVRMNVCCGAGGLGVSLSGT